MNLLAEVTGNDSPDSSLPATLVISMDSPFYSAAQSSGSLITRKLTVLNQGPGRVESVVVNLPSSYVIRLNRCGSLNAGKSCEVTVAYRDSRNSTPPQVSPDQAIATVSSSNIAATFPINLASGQLNTSPSSITANLSFGVATQVKPNIHVVFGEALFGADVTAGSVFSTQISFSNLPLSVSSPTLGTDYLVKFIVSNDEVTSVTPSHDLNISVVISCLNGKVPALDQLSCESPVPSNTIQDISLSLSQCQTHSGILGTSSFDCYPVDGDKSSPPLVQGNWNLSRYNLPDPSHTFAIVSNEASCSSASSTDWANGSSMAISSMSNSQYSFSVSSSDRIRKNIQVVLYKSSSPNGSSMSEIIHCQPVGVFHSERATTTLGGTGQINGPAWCDNCIMPNKNTGIYSVQLQQALNNPIEYISSAGPISFFKSYQATLGPLQSSAVSIVGSDNYQFISTQLTYDPGPPLLGHLLISNSLQVQYSSIYSSTNTISNDAFSQAPRLIASGRFWQGIEMNNGSSRSSTIRNPDSLEVYMINPGTVDQWILRRTDGLEIEISCNLNGDTRKQALDGTSRVFLCYGVGAMGLPSGQYRLVARSAYFPDTTAPGTVTKN